MLGPRTEWIHLPVPKGRTDPKCSAPLSDLKLDGPGLPRGWCMPTMRLGRGNASRLRGPNALFPFSVATE
ncbi:hypothetical protein GGR53DRAFT_498082 [Hypoxylon sp. FL1150]|nr:hypothetical protein GGR53DRAFT_498082 [Hypoxylon sp. FL1150]